MADIQVANTDADLSDNTLLTEENAYTITGLHTFSRSTNAPFACISGAAVVTYLDADKLDGIEATGFIKADGTVALSANWDAGGYEIRSNTFESDVATGTIPLVIASTTKCTNLNADKLDDQEGTYYLAAANATGTLAVGKGGTGATSLADGYVLLGSGTGAITPLDVTTDGAILIGDGSGDPTTLDVGSSTAITILGTIATGVWQGDDIGVAYGGTGASTFTDGGILLGSGTGAITAAAVLGDGEILIGDGSGDPVPLDVGSSTAITSLGTVTAGTWQSTDIGVAYGGTGVSTFTDGGLLVGSGASAITALGVAANGEIPIGDGSGDPQLANITGTSNEIEITNGSASIQVGIVTNPTLGVSNFTGTLANARLPTNIDVGGTLDVTGAATLDSTLTVVNDVAVNTDTIFVDVSEDRVGINTNAPLAPLHIKASTVGSVTPNANSFIVFEKNGSGNYLEFLCPDGTGEGGGLIFKTPAQEGSINFNHGVGTGGTVQLGPNVSTTGAMSKGSGSFNIDHPLPSKTDTHRLVHSFIEGPQCDLIYRGTAILSSGATTVNLDTASGMTEGTWVLLCRNEQCFTSNETGWTSVRGSVTGNILTIECEEGTSTDTISWMVVAERHDTHIMETGWTDEDGHVILEPEKPEEP